MAACISCDGPLDGETPGCVRCHRRHTERLRPSRRGKPRAPSLPRRLSGQHPLDVEDGILVARLWPFLVELRERTESDAAMAAVTGLDVEYVSDVLGTGRRQPIRRVTAATAGRMLGAVLMLRMIDRLARLPIIDHEQRVGVYPATPAEATDATSLGNRRYDPRLNHAQLDHTGSVPESWGQHARSAVERKGRSGR